MKILNETISSQDEKNLKIVELSLCKDVHYSYFDDSITTFGGADYFSNSKFYTVYTRKDIHGHTFVNNLLHELFHLHQVDVF